MNLGMFSRCFSCPPHAGRTERPMRKWLVWECGSSARECQESRTGWCWGYGSPYTGEEAKGASRVDNRELALRMWRRRSLVHLPVWIERQSIEMRARSKTGEQIRTLSRTDAHVLQRTRNYIQTYTYIYHLIRRHGRPRQSKKRASHDIK